MYLLITALYFMVSFFEKTKQLYLKLYIITYYANPRYLLTGGNTEKIWAHRFFEGNFQTFQRYVNLTWRSG